MPIKYHLPSFLKGKEVTRERYVRWLQRKALSLARRDRRRWQKAVSVADYKEAIHKVVESSGGKDFYTQEGLDWGLISKYDNRESQRGGVEYKKDFARLPTVDHVDPTSREPQFQICGWRTNDCKNDLTVEELRQFCEAFLHAQRGKM